MTENGRPPGSHETIPAAPFTSTGCANSTSREKVSACSATARAPRASLDAPGDTAPPSARTTTPGSSTARSASKSPPRSAARKASTTSRWRVRSASGAVVAPCNRRRARLASFLAAVWGAHHDGSNLVKGHGEHVVQHEGERLGGSQRFEYHERPLSHSGLRIGFGALRLLT
jgi:hypothetical protein